MVDREVGNVNVRTFAESVGEAKERRTENVTEIQRHTQHLYCSR